MLTTIADYCTQRGVTKQFVYEYVRKEKFKLIDMPVFTELDGQRIAGGTQKFLSVPESFDPELDFPHFDSQAAFVDSLTDYPELAERHKAFFLLPDNASKAAFKAEMYAEVALRPEAERNAFYAAQARLNDAMMAHMKAMQKHLKRVLKHAKKTSSAQIAG